MSREARPGGFGSSGGGGVLGSLILLALGLVVLISALWFAINAGARYALPLIPKEWDQTVGEYAMKSMVNEDNPCADSQMRWLEKVGPMLVAQVEGEAFPYRWHVIADETPNAFALPGGWVGVHTGLFKLAKRPEEVASVVAHEIIHAEQRHGMRRMLGALGTQLATALIFGGTDLALFADQGMRLLMLKHSRSRRRKRTAWETCSWLTPGSTLRVWRQCSRRSAPRPQAKGLAAWFSTHPDTQARAPRHAPANDRTNPSNCRRSQRRVLESRQARLAPTVTAEFHVADAVRSGSLSGIKIAPNRRGIR